MDTEIREAIARSLPDLAMIVRRDGVILSCVGGNAVRGLNSGDEEIPGRSVQDLWPPSIAGHTSVFSPAFGHNRFSHSPVRMLKPLVQLKFFMSG